MYVKRRLNHVTALFSNNEDNTTTPYIKTFFILCLTLFIAARIALVAIPISERIEPIEVDDSYSYIAKSIIMKDCYSLDCPALTSLRDQISGQGENYRQALVRNRIDLNVFTFYHPLYSALFNAVSAFGFDLVKAFNILYIAFGLLTILGLGLWMKTVWGNFAGGIALLLLSFYVFTGPGLHVFVPSNIALGVALFSWIIILQEKQKRYWLLPLIWMASIGIHTIGIIYSGAAMLLLLLVSGWPIARERLLALASGIAVLLARLGISFTFPQYRLIRGDSEFFASTPSYGEVLMANLNDAAEFILRWMNSYWSVMFLIIIVIIGFIASPHSKRRNIAGTGVVLLSIFAASLAFPNLALGSPAGRIWIPFAFFLTRAVGNFIVSWLVSATLLAKSIAKQGIGVVLNPRLINRPDISRIVIIGLFGFLISISLFEYSRFSARHYGWTLASSTTRQDFFLGEEKLLNAIEEIAAPESILYTKETALYFGLSNGLLENEAVFYPALSETEKEKEWIQDNSNLHYVLAMNPIIRIPNYSKGGIIITKDSPIKFLLTHDDSLNHARILIENSLSGAELLIEMKSNLIVEKAQNLVLQNGLTWVELASLSEKTDEISISLLRADGKVMIRGIQFDGSSTFWPWDKGISIEYLDLSESKKKPSIIALSQDSILSDLRLKIEILADSSSIILGRIDLPPR